MTIFFESFRPRDRLVNKTDELLLLMLSFIRVSAHLSCHMEHFMITSTLCGGKYFLIPRETTRYVEYFLRFFTQFAWTESSALDSLRNSVYRRSFCAPCSISMTITQISRLKISHSYETTFHQIRPVISSKLPSRESPVAQPLRNPLRYFSNTFRAESTKLNEITNVSVIAELLFFFFIKAKITIAIT